MNEKYLFREETYAIIGHCMEVHRQLGHGFLEILYKDALEYELRAARMTYGREVRFDVHYKGHKLPHYYFADFTVFNKVILEVKSIDGLHNALLAQTLNYLKVSGYRIGLLVNFGKNSLEYRRLIL